MKLQKILLSGLLVFIANSYAMNEASEQDLPVGIKRSVTMNSLTSAVTSTESIESNRSFTTLKGAFIPGGAKRTTLCRYPVMCFSYNEIKRAAGVEAKPDSDPEIVDARNRISTPVRELLKQHATNPNLRCDEHGNDIFARGGSLPKESDCYQRFTAVVKAQENDAIIMKRPVSLDELAILNNKIEAAIGQFSHVPTEATE